VLKVFFAEYSSAIGQSGNPMPLTFKREEEFSVITNACQKISQSLHLLEDNIFWFRFKRAILRLKQIGNKEFMEKTAKELQMVENVQSSSPHKEIAQIITIWKTDPAIEVDPNDPSIVKEWPVIFGSSKYSVEHDLRPHQFLASQLLIEHPLDLGKDMDLVYTSIDAIDHLSKILKPKRITVLPEGVGRLQATKQMAMGSMMRSLQAETKELASLQTSITPLKNIFHHIILPYYATPLPQLLKKLRRKNFLRPLSYIVRPIDI
jgi:hypothetical protein